MKLSINDEIKWFWVIYKELLIFIKNSIVFN